MLRREVLDPPRSTRTRIWLAALAIAFLSSIVYVGTQVMHELGNSKADVARMKAKETADAFHRWRARHPDAPCPRSPDDLGDYSNFDIRHDPWGNRYVIACDERDAIVISPGPDGRLGTADDIFSY